MADTNDLYARGLRRRKKMFGEVDVEKRMAAAGEFGAPLQNVINAYVYGDVWERAGLSDDVRSLVMLGITAASSKPAEFAVHAKGALANGCTRAQVQDVQLLIAMYCGIPAAIETNRDCRGDFRKRCFIPPMARNPDEQLGPCLAARFRQQAMSFRLSVIPSRRLTGKWF
ncbi:MAG: carboxymuconolactone decarboxylase family protein [Bradyrhizobium sp.]